MFCCGKCWCVYRDPIGYLAFVIGLLQVLFVNVCTIGIVIYPTYGFSTQGILLTSLIVFFTIMVLWCGFKASFTEPGIVTESRKVSDDERQFYIEERWSTYCKYCDQLKPFRAHHCRKCGTCVLKMDHHCPWINNCVGARNQKYFILYLIYVHMGEMLASLLGGWCIWTRRGYIQYYTELVYLRYFYPINHYLPRWMLDHLFLPVFHPSVYKYVFLIIEVFFSLIFAVFVVVLLYDQIRSIRYDLTYVEYLKQYRINTAENTFYDCLVSTMGEPFCWRWFFPIEGKYMNAIIQKLSTEFITFDLTGDDDYDDMDEQKQETSMDEKKNQ